MRLQNAARVEHRELPSPEEMADGKGRGEEVEVRPVASTYCVRDALVVAKVADKVALTVLAAHRGAVQHQRLWEGRVQKVPAGAAAVTQRAGQTEAGHTVEARPARLQPRGILLRLLYIQRGPTFEIDVHQVVANVFVSQRIACRRLVDLHLEVELLSQNDFGERSDHSRRRPVALVHANALL